MKKLYAFVAAAAIAMSASAADIYMIGNFCNWDLTKAVKMTEASPNVYTTSIAELQSGFKFNDGTWDNPDCNWGLESSSMTIELDQATPVVTSGSSANVAFPTGMSVVNAEITLDLNAKTVLVKGTAVWEEVKWYLAGTMNWSPWDSDENVFEKYEEGLYKLQMTFTGDPATEIKVTTANWGESYGMGADSQPLAMGQFSTGVLENNSQTNIPCSLAGTWWMQWDLTNKILTALSEEPKAGVEGIEADNNTEAVYYNLQGVRVNNPENGLYIVKQGNKVSKAYIF